MHDKALDLNPNFAERDSDNILSISLRCGYPSDPNYANAYNNRGTAKAETGQHFEASFRLRCGFLLNPNYANAYNNRGVAKNALGHPEAAIPDYNKAIRLTPNDADIYHNRECEGQDRTIL